MTLRVVPKSRRASAAIDALTARLAAANAVAAPLITTVVPPAAIRCLCKTRRFSVRVASIRRVAQGAEELGRAAVGWAIRALAMQHVMVRRRRRITSRLLTMTAPVWMPRRRRCIRRC